MLACNGRAEAVRATDSTPAGCTQRGRARSENTRTRTTDQHANMPGKTASRIKPRPKRRQRDKTKGRKEGQKAWRRRKGVLYAVTPFYLHNLLLEGSLLLISLSLPLPYRAKYATTVHLSTCGPTACTSLPARRSRFSRCRRRCSAVPDPRVQ